MIDETLLIELLQLQIYKNGNDYWKDKIKAIENRKIHLAIMVEPYLTRILKGEKTIESRFSTNRITPFKKVYEGEIILLKKSGGPIVALFEAGVVHSFEFSNKGEPTVNLIKEKYNNQLKIDDDFWNAKKDSKYATLINVKNLLVIEPISLKFLNRQSWILLERIARKENKQMSLFDNYKKQIICIVGEIASGKTTLSKELSASMNCFRYSVSDYLKVEAKNRGYDSISREILQEVGAECIGEGWITFCKKFVDFIEWNQKHTIIIDGIRHKEFFEALQIITSPYKNWLFYLDVNKIKIEERLLQRGESLINYPHLAEGNLHELKAIADSVLTAENKAPSELAAEILSIIST